MNGDRGGGRPERDQGKDRRFLIALIALVVVMDLAESIFWLLEAAWRLVRRGARRFALGPRSSASADTEAAVSNARSRRSLRLEAAPVRATLERIRGTTDEGCWRLGTYRDRTSDASP